MKKPARSISGVAVVAVMSPAFSCPGECLYCFRGEGAAQSYTGMAPSARRAIMHGYDPFSITRSRIGVLEGNGHPTDKLEVIVMGGTFNAFPRSFQQDFVKRIFDAANGRDSLTLAGAHLLNESAPHRIISLTFETRPDWATIGELNWMLDLGATRIELGVQSLFDDVLELNRRGHRVAETKRATRDARDLGFKVGYHMMPGLPGSSPHRDREMFRRLFSEDFQPDMLKIYPTLVIEGSELHSLHEQGLYSPMGVEDAVEVVSFAKSLIPPWVRLMRVQRDIPAPEIHAGIKKGNLRELVWRRMEERGSRCRCIRCREVRDRDAEPGLVERRYRAGGAEEVFISWEDGDRLVGFVRLRLLERALRPELEGAAVVRELRVFGPEARLGERGKWQHRGYGRRLMEEAERVARERYEKLAVIAGVGVRPYFRRLGYAREGPYMTKHFKPL